VPSEKRFGFSEWKINNCNHDYLNWNYYDEDNILHPETTYEPIKLTDLALDFLERKKDGPFALYLSWSTPHSPYHHMPQKYLDIYKDKPVTLRENVQDTMDMLHAEPFGEGYRLTTKIQDTQFIEDMYRGYYGHITALDEQFGRLVDYLEENNLSENTIVVFTSDHGDMLGEHGIWYKRTYYEDSVRVPFIVSQPKAPVEMKSAQSMYNMVLYKSVRSTILPDNIQRVTRGLRLIFSLWLIHLYTQNGRDVCLILTTTAVSQLVSVNNSLCPPPILTLHEIQREA
jgi:arylsulfatase A-like enzyme